MTHHHSTHAGTTQRTLMKDATMLHHWSDNAVFPAARPRLSLELQPSPRQILPTIARLTGVTWLLRRYDCMVSSLLGSERGRS